MSAYVLGKNCVAYYSTVALTGSTNTALNTALDAAIAIDNIKDVKINLSKDKADVTTRGSGGWKQTAATLKDGTISFTMQWKPGDAAFNAFLAAWTNDSEIAFFALDGPQATAANQGPAGNYSVTNFSRNEPLGEAVTVDVELSPSSFNGWVTST